MQKNHNVKTQRVKNIDPKWADETKLIHAGIERSQHGETAETLYLTQGYIYESAQSAMRRFSGEEEGYIYSRYVNPTVKMFQERIAELENAQGAVATASGMAAVSASILCQVQKGDHVIAARALFGSCRYVIEKLLPKFGVESTLVDGKNIKEWESKIKKNTKVFFVESPTNPTLEIIDIKKIGELAKQNNICFIVDNVFASPLYQKPMELGADVVVYSATKHIDGQGRCLGGVILAKQEWIDEKLYEFHKHTGPAISPFNAWVLLKGLETLPVRLQKATDNAEIIAQFLSQHKKIKKTIYPNHPNHPQYQLAKKQMKRGSTLVAFEIVGDQKHAFKFENELKLIGISNNLGDAKSLITHPATTTHSGLDDEEKEKLGINQRLLRLSVGMENPNDLVNDINKALLAI